MTSEHAKAFTMPSVELVSIFNRTKSKAQAIAELHSIPIVSDDLDTMLRECKPDLVVMAVYEPAIRDVACRILEHPVALLMEKPIGLDLEQARQVHAFAKHKSRRVWVGLNRRTTGSTQAVLDDLAANPGPRFIHVQDQQGLKEAAGYGHVPVVVTNWMYANSIHLVDYLLTFGRGTVTDLRILQPWDPEHAGVVLAHVSFSSGDKGIYQATWNGPGPWSCTVSAPHRRWELRPLEKAVFQNANERKLTEISVPEADIAYKPGLRLQAEKVISSWRGEDTGAVTIDEAMATTELVARIYGLEHTA